MENAASIDTNCYCSSLPDLAVVPMGMDDLDQRVFASLEQIVEHGGEQWWLFVASCVQCSQDWMVAQDSRIYDTYYMRRISLALRRDISEKLQWPDEFLTYEKVLRLGKTMSKPWTFLDPRSPGLVWTAEDLRRERPGISVKEIADLLAISVPDAARLLQKPNVFGRFRSWITQR